jgi:ornithine decarboxylase
MALPVTELFRILVIGEPSGVVRRIIAEDLHFNVTEVPSEGVGEAIRAGSDVGAIIVSTACPGAIAARDGAACGCRSSCSLLAPTIRSRNPFSNRSTVSSSPRSRRATSTRRGSSLQSKYASTLLIFGTLMRYDLRRQSAWACPGHQGRQMFMRHPVGQLFYEHGREHLPGRHRNAMVSLGDLLIHGPALTAQQSATNLQRRSTYSS